MVKNILKKEAFNALGANSPETMKSGFSGFEKQRGEKKKLSKTEISSPIRKSKKRKTTGKKMAWEYVKKTLSIKDQNEKEKEEEKSDSFFSSPSPIKDEDDVIADEEDSFKMKVSPGAKNSPDLDRMMHKMNDSVNNMSRRSVMKLKNVEILKHKNPNQDEIKKRLINLKMTEPEYNRNLNDNELHDLTYRHKSRLPHQIDNKKIDKILKLGPMGMDLEELRVGIERKYEDMMNQLKNKLEMLKGYFSSLLDNIRRDFNEAMINEKQLNLDNLKELEGYLLTAKEQAEKEGEYKGNYISENQVSLLALQDFFTFAKEFKEECYSLIVSQFKELNMAKLKKELEEFTSKNLNSLNETPKSFATQLYRFFLANQEIYEEEVDVTHGEALSLTAMFPEEVNFKNTLSTLEPELEAKRNRTPLVKLISDKYMVVSGRNEFKIFSFSWYDKIAGANPNSKSRFFRKSKSTAKKKRTFDYKLVFSSWDDEIDRMKEKLEKKRKNEIKSPTKPNPQSHYLGFNSLIKPSDIKEIKDNITPGFHCICHLKCKTAAKEMLLFGGNFNVFLILTDFRNCISTS
jgi:hypothetical protein